MERRGAIRLAEIARGWQRARAATAGALSTPDVRWAIVSSSATALVAGAIAWMAAGTMPPMDSRDYHPGKDRALIPYELFLRLAAQHKATNLSYGALGSSGGLGLASAHVVNRPSVQLDNLLADERGGKTDDGSSGTDTRIRSIMSRMRSSSTSSRPLKKTRRPSASASSSSSIN